MIEVMTEDIVVNIVNDIDVSSTGNIAVVVEDNNELDITVAKKEFVITGDNIYVPVLYDDVPQWMKDLVSLSVNQAIEGVSTSNLDQLNSMLAEFATSYVPLNQYTESILDLSNADVSLHALIETLNSTYEDGINSANSQIISLQETKASKDEVLTQVVETISAQLANADSDVGATIARIDQAILDSNSASALSYQAIIATLESMDGEIAGSAQAIAALEASVTNINGELVSQASDITQLRTDLNSGIDTWATADTAVTNSLSTSITNNRVAVESKWAYNSNIVLNGTPYNSGFGLATNVNSGTIPVGQSEFWIRADKFKISNATNANYQPFTISNNNVVFNGKVTFNNGQVGTIDEAIAAVVETASVGDKNINITDNLIPVTSLVADTDNSGYQFIGTPTKSNATGIDGFAEAQIVLDGIDEVYSPYVDEVTIPYYFRIGISGITSLSKIKICTINSSNTVTYGTLTYTLDAGQSLVSGNWYIIDGIINPTGGATQAEGTIRLAEGTKIGTISNYAIPSGTAKIVLGWVANCTISRMKLAKITADTLTGSYVTQDYVDATVSNVVQNTASDATKQEMAIGMGFANYGEMVAQFALLGSTLINGGYINTGLLQANSILANQINATGLIAENISGNIISGKKISGGVIEGASIQGVTISASYLDLDRQLQVLTNYYLCVGGNTTGVPTDAINEGRYETYSGVPGDSVPSTEYGNLRRIPSISIIYEESFWGNLNYAGAQYNSKIKSLKNYTAGHNIKCKRPNVPVNVSSNIMLFRMASSGTDEWVLANVDGTHSYDYSLYIGETLLCVLTLKGEYIGEVGFGDGSMSGYGFRVYLNGNKMTSSQTLNVNGLSINLNLTNLSVNQFPGSNVIEVVINPQNANVYFAHSTISLLRIIASGTNTLVNANTWNGPVTYDMSGGCSTALSVNNMT